MRNLERFLGDEYQAADFKIRPERQATSYTIGPNGFYGDDGRIERMHRGEVGQCFGRAVKNCVAQNTAENRKANLKIISRNVVVKEGCREGA